LSIFSIIFTYRRGAFLGLAAVVFMLLLKTNKKIISVAVLLLTLIIAPYFVTERWVDRMETIKTYEQDRSAMGRINAWKMTLNVVKDRPLTGAGFDGLTGNTIDIYSPNPAATAADVHSIYFEVLGEHGVIAFGLFIALLLSAFSSLRKLRRTFSDNPSYKWLYTYSDMIQVSLVAYIVGGAFLGRAYFDLFYHLIIMVVILKVLARKEIKQLTANPVSSI